jgi:leader peptidase (prepilin peptidase) / N-methyltransferase
VDRARAASRADNPGWSALEAALRAGGTAAALLAVRVGCARLRHREGLRLGDVKLAAAIGAWLPLAANAALILVLFARLRGRSMAATAKLPFGAFSARRCG